MTKFVFVHGVSTRLDAGFDDEVAARNRRFTDVSFAGGSVEISNPYWGDFGANPAWKLACVPSFSASYSTLGGLGGPPSTKIDETGNLLLTAAKQDFSAVVGGLSAASMDEVGDVQRLLDSEKFWTLAAAFADDHPHPAWLNEIMTDKEFFDRLNGEVKAQDRDATVPLGLFDPIKAAADKFAGGVTDLVNSPIARAAREKLTPKVAIFMGDVFEYLKAGSARTNIRATVMTAIAGAARKA